MYEVQVEEIVQNHRLPTSNMPIMFCGYDLPSNEEEISEYVLSTMHEEIITRRIRKDLHISTRSNECAPDTSSIIIIILLHHANSLFDH